MKKINKGIFNIPLNSQNAPSSEVLSEAIDSVVLADKFGVDEAYFFHNIFIINNASNEKLCICNTTMDSATGAGTATNRYEQVFKWANTSDQITEIDIDNTTGSVDISNSFIKVWGSN